MHLFGKSVVDGHMIRIHFHLQQLSLLFNYIPFLNFFKKCFASYELSCVPHLNSFCKNFVVMYPRSDELELGGVI